MRTFFARGKFVLTLAMVAAACAKAPEPVSKADEGAIKSAVDSITAGFIMAVSARDTDAVVKFYSNDARILPPGMARLDGHDGARRLWAGMLRTPGLTLELNSRDLIISEAGDVAVDVGEYAMKSQGAARVLTEVGKYVTVLKKVGGEWKIIVDTFNSDGPTTAPSP
jgi:ketosteroid isomerase-like protein